MLLIPADRTAAAGWIGLESEECIIRICFCFLASISSDWARWRDRGGVAQHAASVQRNPFIALMSVKMPDGSDDKREANEFPPRVLGVDQELSLQYLSVMCLV